MQRTVGDVRITGIVELETVGGTRFILPQVGPDEVTALPWLVPQFASAEGRLKMAVQSLVVETPSQRIVVDTCLGNDKQGRKVPIWNDLHTSYIADMTAAGYPPESIDMVICTHLHVDHVGWNTMLKEGKWVPTFPNARYVFGRCEYDYWNRHHDDEHSAVFDDSVKPIVDADRAELVASDQELTDEISLISTPGHSPGHMSVLVRSDGRQALLTGDVAHHPIQMAHLDWSSTVDSDPAQSTRSRRELFSRFADTDTLVFGGHFDAGYIRRDGDAFRFETASRTDETRQT